MKILKDINLRSKFISAQSLIDKKKGLVTYPFGIKALDQVLNGGISPGFLYEFGMPLGFEGRTYLLSLLKTITRNGIKVIWISPENKLLLNPAIFFAHKVDLTQIRFACADRPLVDLKALFLESLFQVIVLDSPGLIKKDAFSFLNNQIRENNQTIIILRNYLLKNELGNIWSQVRINCYPKTGAESQKFEIVRGPHR